MTFVVTESCIKCKYGDCVEVCPVNCFYEGHNMMVINPDECIDCGVCEPECPAEAIKPESNELLEMIELNREYSAIWPRITSKNAPLEDADKYRDEPDKFKKYFDPRPGKGD